jgi:hypothetical protein
VIVFETTRRYGDRLLDGQRNGQFWVWGWSQHLFVFAWYRADEKLREGFARVERSAGEARLFEPKTVIRTELSTGRKNLSFELFKCEDVAERFTS